ncbi:MAG: peptidylprolyl isomerase [Bryobacteraceae bacterium]
MALEINGERVEDAAIRAEARILRPRCAQMFAGSDPLTAEMQLRELAQERIIERVMLRQQAEQDTSPIQTEALDQAHGQIQENCVTPMNESILIEDTRAQLRLDRLIGKVIGKVAKPKRKEVIDYYRKHPDEFHSPELIRVAHIVKNVDESTPELAARSAIEELRRQLDSGADFVELADAHSDCPGGGGDLGWFPRGQMVAEFDDAVFSLGIGQISPVFRTAFGFHIAKALNRQPGGMRAFDEVQSALQDQLHKRKQHRALGDYIANLRTRVEVRRVK